MSAESLSTDSYEFFVPKPSLAEMMSSVCNSQLEALAMPRNCRYSPLVGLP